MSARLLHYSDLENAYDDPERIGRLAGTIDALRDPDTVVVGTGDNTSPGVLSMVHEGRQALDFFAAVAPAADTFGNHDFDYGPNATRDIVARSPQTWVSANVERDGDRFGADVGVVPSTVVETDSSRIGVTGVTDPKTAQMCPGASDFTFTDPVAAVQRETERLREQDVDAVVVLSHLGHGDDRLARRTSVDAVLGGHLHEERVDEIAGTTLTRPSANGHVLLSVDLDHGGVERHAVADGPLDEAVAKALEERWSSAGLDAVVGRVDQPIRREKGVTGSGECRIGNFVADAYRWAADADVGLQNTGGIREGDPLAGEVTVADIVSVVPFDEPVAVAEVTGDELRALAREADGRRIPELPDRWHGHFSGLEVRENGSGEMRVDLTDGELQADATYTLATTDYLFHTDHEFPVLDESHRHDQLDVQYEIIAAYARDCGLDPTIESRIERPGR
jgi:2',3'-cyclic-nucleotide 2'-phosphodiesterase (5'-nucleotidase family)